MSLRRLWSKLCGGLGFQVTPGASSPGDANTLWADSNASDVPMWGAVRVVLSNTQAATGEPTGFESPSAVTSEYDSVNRTITLTQSGGVVIWFQGVRHVLVSPWTSDAHAATDGGWFLSMGAGGVVSWSQTPWTFDTTAQLAYANYNTPAGDSFGVREQHGLMPWQCHEEDHYNIGTYRFSGGLLTDGTYTVQPGAPTDADNTPGFDAAVIKDEDLPTTIAAWAQGSYTLLHFTGVGTPVLTKAAALPIRTGTTYPIVNTVSGGTFSDVETVTARYLNVYQILIPVTTDAGSQVYRTLMLQPQVAHTSLAAAQAEDFRSLNLGTLTALSVEFVAFTRLTYRTNSSYNVATGRIRIEATAYLAGNRASQVAISNLTPVSHTSLADRSLADQHPSAAINYDNGIVLNTAAAAPTYAEGTVFWDTTDKCLAFYPEINGPVMQVGQEFWLRGVNKTGSTLLDGQVVYISGAQGNRPTVSLADATALSGDETIGVVTYDIADDAEGYVCTQGLVRGYNTSGFSAGDRLWLDPANPGELTNTKPTAPDHAVGVAWALNSTNNGAIYVDVDCGNDLASLHDVSLASLANNQVIAYESISQTWKNTGGYYEVTTSTTLSALLNKGIVEQTADSVTTTLWSPTTGDTITIRNSSGTGNTTIDGDGIDIETGSTIILADGESVTLAYTGIKWIIV
jgi:hypothetical protein